MLGSFQRARNILHAEVDKLRTSQAELEHRLRDQDNVQEELAELRAKTKQMREENRYLQQELARRQDSENRASREIRDLRDKAARLDRELEPLREERLALAQHAAEQQRRAQLAREELDQLQGAEAALEEALGVLWQMLEDLAMQFSLAPPWRCSLCSCSNPHSRDSCVVCEVPNDGSTDCGNKVCEAYFEFRFHQEFLAKRPPPPPEQQLASLRIALGHREEGWIQREEVEELVRILVKLAGNQAADIVLRAESAFVLFSLGDESAKGLGRMMLQDMGRRTDAVKLMCRRLQEQRVAVLFHRLLVMKKHDVEKFRSWEERFKQAQARFFEVGPAEAVERSRSSMLALSRSVTAASNYSLNAELSPVPSGQGMVLPGAVDSAAEAAVQPRQRSAMLAKRDGDEAEEKDDDDDDGCRNAFPLRPYETYSAAGLVANTQLWSASQLALLFIHDQWSVGETWTFSAEVTSHDTEDREFGFSGGGGFFTIDVPAGADCMRITVTDKVKSVSSKFVYRGRNGTVGDVTFTDIYMGPGSVVPASYKV